MEYSYKFRIYPNKEQENLIHRTFGCVRFIYNYFLEKRIKEYKENNRIMSFYDCTKELTKLKHLDEYSWLNEVDSTALQSAVKNVDDAYKKFFISYKKHTDIGYPKFKSKHSHRKSYRAFGSDKIKVYEGYIKLPKLKKVKCKISRNVKGRILNATIIQEPSGKYYVSICCTNVVIPTYKTTGSVIGLDLGIKKFIVDSNGNTYDNNKFLYKSEKQLCRLQRMLSRKPKESNRREKTRIIVARLYEHIYNQRMDYLQKLSTNIIKENDIICIENLSIKNMIKNKKLSKAISDVSWGKFIKMLEYKSIWHKKKVIKVDKFFPSSQLCSMCGYKNEKIKNLSIREWTCPICGSAHDRDKNAAKNILSEGMRLLYK